MQCMAFKKQPLYVIFSNHEIKMRPKRQKEKPPNGGGKLITKRECVLNHMDAFGADTEVPYPADAENSPAENVVLLVAPFQRLTVPIIYIKKGATHKEVFLHKADEALHLTIGKRATRLTQLRLKANGARGTPHNAAARRDSRPNHGKEPHFSCYPSAHTQGHHVPQTVNHPNEQALSKHIVL